MDELTHDILVTLEKLSDNVGGLPLTINDFIQFTNDTLYFEIFQALFPTQNLDNLKEHMSLMKPSDRIQILIDILSQEILKLDLSHINGEAIYKGDKKHILNFLQLLYEISKMFNEKRYEKGESMPSTSKNDGSKRNSNGSYGKTSKSSDNEGYTNKRKDIEQDEGEDSVIDLLQNVEADAYMKEYAEIINRGSGSGYDRNYRSGYQDDQIQNIKNKKGLINKQAAVDNENYDDIKENEQMEGVISNNSVSRISEVSKSKESSEYEHKKVSTFSSQFSGGQSGEKHAKKNTKKSSTMKGKEGKKSHHGSRSLGEIGNKQDYDDKELQEQEIEEEELYNIDEKNKIREIQDQHNEIFEDEEEAEIEEQEVEEEVVEEEEEEEEVNDEKLFRKISKEGGINEEIEFYQRDPINYNKLMVKYEKQGGDMKKGQSVDKKVRKDHVPEQENEKIKSYEIKKSKNVSKGTIKPAHVPKFNPKNVQIRPLTSKPYIKEQRLSYKPYKSVVKQVLGRKSSELIQKEQDGSDQLRESAEDIHDSNYQKEDQEEPEYMEECEDEIDPNIQLLPEQNVYKILSENLFQVKKELANLKDNNLPIDEPQTNEKILQLKNRYKTYLNNYLEYHNIKNFQTDKMYKLAEKSQKKKIKHQMKDEKHLKEEFENHQKSLYLKQRDAKIRYIRNIHKVIFELEKKKIIEDKKEYIEFRKLQNEQARNIIESIENAYKNKLELLKEKHIVDQNERKLIEAAQKELVRKLEVDLKNDKKKQIEQLQERWRNEKDRFDMMIKDDGYLEQKIVELYKKS